MKRLILLIFFLFSFSLLFAQGTDSMQFSRTISSGFFGKGREISIVLPYGYYRNSDQRYPVAYVFDAQSEDLFNFTASLIHSLSLTQSLEPMIIVGIKSENRQFEFTPKNHTAAPYQVWGKDARIGGADTLLSSLEMEVFPYIEQHYRTVPVRLGLGHSLGGTFVTWCLTSGKKIFDGVIAISPNYDYDKEQLVDRVKEYVAKSQSPHSFLYIARGKTDRYETLFSAGIEKVVTFIRKKNPPHLQLTYELLNVNKHGNTFLQGFINGLTTWHNSIYLKAGTTIKYFTELSEKYSYTLNPDQINQLAYNYFMVPGTYPEAIKIFKWAIKLYPQDFNLYDSKSEAEENMGNKKAAVSSCMKSIAKLEEQKNKINQKTYEDAKKYFLEKLERLKK
jgi:predicted alpha/beta superfamily hydrolase